MEHDFVYVEYSSNQLFHLVVVIVDERGHCEVEKCIRFAFFRSKILWPIKNCQVLGTGIFMSIPWKTPWILFALSCTNSGQVNHDVWQHFCCSTVAPRCRINLYFLQGLMQRKRFKSPLLQVARAVISKSYSAQNEFVFTFKSLCHHLHFTSRVSEFLSCFA